MKIESLSLWQWAGEEDLRDTVIDARLCHAHAMACRPIMHCLSILISSAQNTPVLKYMTMTCWQYRFTYRSRPGRPDEQANSYFFWLPGSSLPHGIPSRCSQPRRANEVSSSTNHESALSRPWLCPTDGRVVTDVVIGHAVSRGVP